MKRVVFLAFLLLVTVSLLSADSLRIVPQTGHIDAISSMAIHTLDGALVTASHDGSLRVWETNTRRLQYKMQVSALPLVDMVLHPDKPRAAVIESDGISIHRLSIWDWAEHKRIFSRELPAMPNYLAFSPAGTYIAYSVADWQSMTVINADSGVRLPYIRNGFGIVSAFRISSSEERIVIYLPSGSIQYRNLRSGTLMQEFPTIADIVAPAFVLSNRYMLGKWEDNLIAVDLLSGDDVGSVRVPNLVSFTANEETGDVLCLVESGTEPGTQEYLSYSFSGTTFRSRYNRYKPPADITANDASSRTVFAGTENGDIYYQTTYSSSPRPFSTSRLAAVHDFDSSSGLILTTPDSIITMYADYLYGSSAVPATNPLLSHTQPNPLDTVAKITSVGDGIYVLQDDSEETGRYWLFSPVEGAIGFPNDRYEAPILATSIKDRRILTVDKNGTIQIYSLFRDDFEFETRLFGLKTAIFTDGDNIVAGGRRSQSLRTSKLLVDTSTGESVPFNDDSQETFQLAYEPLSHSLYSLSMEGSATDPKTVLTEHSGPIFENSKTLYSMAGKHADATMSVGRGTLFFSGAGVNRALYAGTGRFTPVDGNDNIPVKVEVIDDWFLALNRDSSLSVWHRASGIHALDFYLFEDLEWVAVTASGEIFSSASRTDAYVREYQ